MTAQFVDTLPESIAATIWSWFKAMPARARSSTGYEGDEENFAESFDDDLKVLVFDDGDLLGFVTAEPKGNDIYDIHLFCPRRVSTEKLTLAIDEFFRLVAVTPGIEKLLFSVRSIQSRLGQILIANDCCFTGWSYYEQGEVFRCLLWEK